MTPEELSDQVLLSQRPESRVYQAQSPTGERVVYKQFLFQQAQNWKQYELFERESEALTALKHPQIPQLLAHGNNDSGPWLINQWMPGDTLSDKLAAGWHPTETEIRSVLEQSLAILDWLHERHPPIVHRDIKPSNLVIADDGKVSLIDFGSVLLKWQKDGGSTVAGTFGYMAPEQLTGRSSPTSDLYSMGATIVHLLTGKEPSDLPQERLRINFEDHCQCSLQLKKIISKLLAPIPEDRFVSAHQALSALRNVLNVIPQKSSITVQKLLNHLPELPESQAGDTGLEVSYTDDEVTILIPACGTSRKTLIAYANYRVFHIVYPLFIWFIVFLPPRSFNAFFFIVISTYMTWREWQSFHKFTQTETHLHLRNYELVIEEITSDKSGFHSIGIKDVAGIQPNTGWNEVKQISLYLNQTQAKRRQKPIGIGQNLSKAEQDWLCKTILAWRSQGLF